MTSPIDDSQWYPSRSEIDALERSLEALRSNMQESADSEKELATLSKNLLSWMLVPEFPKYLTKRWLWLASLLRRAIGAEARRNVAAAILYFNRATEPSQISASDIRKLRWVIDSISQQVGQNIGSTTRILVDENDAQRIEHQISQLLAIQIDVEALTDSISERTQALRELCGPWCFPSLLSKIEQLQQVARDRGSDRSRIASAALAYFAADDDAIPDKLGVLGLIDDIYVVEWAYAACTGTTLLLPILEKSIERWPFLDDLLFRDEEGLIGFDRYVTFLISSILFSLFERERQVILARESGPSALLAAICAAVASKMESRGPDVEACLPSNTSVFLGNDQHVFRAVYKRPETIAGRKKHWIAVAQNGNITIDDTALQFMRVAPSPHTKPLSKGNQISAWLEERHPSALTFIANQSQRTVSNLTSVLLLTQRRKLDEALADIRPFGLDLAMLVDIRYVGSSGDIRHFTSAAASVPPVYVVSDSDAAIELLSRLQDPPLRWLVIVDGADAAVGFYGAMRSSQAIAKTPICVIAEWHEREHCAALIDLGMSLSCVDFSDVEISAAKVQAGVSADGSALRKYIRRSELSSSSVIQHHTIRNPGFELLDEACRKLGRTRENTVGTSLDRLVVSVVGFIKKATGYPIAFDSGLKSELFSLASRLRSEAFAIRLFSPEVHAIFDVFELLLAENEICPDRTQALRALTNGFEEQERIAVVCRSAVVASACASYCVKDPVLRRLLWLSPDRMRAHAPFDRLVVATWLGRSTMREICNCGFAGTVHFILFPFEKDLLESTTKAAAAWRNRLTKGSTGFGLTPSSTGRSIWTTWKPARLMHTDLAVEEIEEQTPEIDEIEARVIAAIKQGPRPGAEGDRTVGARLVLFEETGAYAYLPPGGKIIALSALTEIQLEPSNDAERLLFKKTEALRPGMVVAFATSTSRDLVDARADQFLKTPDLVRARASKWKDAVRHFIEFTGNSYDSFSDLLERAGESREPSTIQGWVLGNDTIAPRNYANVIPQIAQITKDPGLSNCVSDTIRAIEQIYSARQQAAAMIVQEIFAGEIDLDADFIDFELDGQRVRYELHRVRSVEPKTVNVAFDLVGRVLRYQDLVVTEPSGLEQ